MKQKALVRGMMCLLCGTSSSIYFSSNQTAILQASYNTITQQQNYIPQGNTTGETLALVIAMLALLLGVYAIKDSPEQKTFPTYQKLYSDASQFFAPQKEKAIRW